MSLLTNTCQPALILSTLLVCLAVTSTMAFAYCPAGCQCDDNTLAVHCNEGQLDVLPIALNPFVQRLVLKNNKIKIIDSSIQFYSQLTFLDLSSNHLMNIPQRTFAYQRNLQEVHLQYNKISYLSKKTFIGLSAVTVVNLRGNLISELNQDTFAALTNLEELNLGENRIDFIHPKAFDGLSQLRILYLDDNALTSVPYPMHFQAVPLLAELFLGNNALRTLPSAAFQYMKGLTNLNLKGSGLRNISYDSFVGLESLRILDLSDNLLNHVPTSSFSRLERLEQLFLGQNDFESILEGAFVGLKQLKRLEITGAFQLKRVIRGAFSNNTNLEYLNLSSNKMLNEIEEGAFNGLPHLRYINLKANGLTTLAEGLFPWEDLNSLDISENPIACDCRIMWLRNILSSKNIISARSNKVLCEFPQSLRGEELKNLNPDLMGDCSHADNRTQAMTLTLLAGIAVAIACLSLMTYHCRYRIIGYLQSGKSVLNNEDSIYQRTSYDEECQHHPSNLGAHSQFPNTYTSYNMVQTHYGLVYPVPVQAQCFQQLQVPASGISNIKTGSKNCVVLPKQNHYTMPQLRPQLSNVPESCYSYAVFPIVYNHQQSLHYNMSQDSNPIYSNTNCNTHLGQSTEQNVETLSSNPEPPALPQRNPSQILNETIREDSQNQK